MKMAPIDLHDWIIGPLWWDCLGRIGGVALMEEACHWRRLWGFKSPHHSQLTPSASNFQIRMWALSYCSSVQLAWLLPFSPPWWPCTYPDNVSLTKLFLLQVVVLVMVSYHRGTKTPGFRCVVLLLQPPQMLPGFCFCWYFQSFVFCFVFMCQLLNM